MISAASAHAARAATYASSSASSSRSCKLPPMIDDVAGPVAGAPHAAPVPARRSGGLREVVLHVARDVQLAARGTPSARNRCACSSVCTASTANFARRARDEPRSRVHTKRLRRHLAVDERHGHAAAVRDTDEVRPELRLRHDEQPRIEAARDSARPRTKGRRATARRGAARTACAPSRARSP